MEQLSHRKRSRVDSAECGAESEVDSTKVKRFRDDLLRLFDEPDTVPDRDPVSHDLDSVIRSFEEEISGSGSSSPATLIDLTSEPGESSFRPGLVDGAVGESARLTSESAGIGGLWEFQDELPSYDPFGFGLELDYGTNIVAGDVDQSENGNDYVALDGIFDYSDVNFGSDFSWRSETLPTAL